MSTERNWRKFTKLSVYDAEHYEATGKKNKTLNLEVTGLDDDQLNDFVTKQRLAQKKKNAEYRKTHPRASRWTKKAPEPAPQPIGTAEPAFKPLFDQGTGNTFCLFGASKSGKTTLMMRIYNEWWPEYEKPKRTLTTLFAMNPQIKAYDSSPYDHYIIKCPVNPLGKSNVMSNIEEYIDWQRRTNRANENKFCFLNMFDDWIDVRHKGIVNNLLITYRNSIISSIICLQYVNLLSKAARSNINNVFLLHMNTDESIEVAVKAFLSAFLRKKNNNVAMSLEESIQWYRDHTDNHNWIYINPLHGCVYLSKTGQKYQL